MLIARASMVAGSGNKLGNAATIATRWSCVRKQGFLDTASGVSYKTEERQIIDYKIQ